MTNYRISFHGEIPPPHTLHTLTTLANDAGYDVSNVVDRWTTILVLGADITERPPSARKFGLCTLTIEEFIQYATDRIVWLNAEAYTETA